MSSLDQTVARLQQLEAHRAALQAMEAALQSLTPAERLVTQLLLIAPARGNVQQLCQLLEREPSSIYRLRRRALQKLTNTLYPSN